MPRGISRRLRDGVKSTFLRIEILEYRIRFFEPKDMHFLALNGSYSIGANEAPVWAANDLESDLSARIYPKSPDNTM